MKILKAIAGIILILIGSILTLGTIVGIPQYISDFSELSDPEPVDYAYRASYAIGTVIGLLIILTIIFFCFKFGIKLLRRKSVLTEENTEEY